MQRLECQDSLTRAEASAILVLQTSAFEKGLGRRRKHHIVASGRAAEQSIAISKVAYKALPAKACIPKLATSG